MIEYLYDTIRATSGQDICVCAQITDDNGVDITEDCSLGLHDDDNVIAFVSGTYTDGEWDFIIPADLTKGLHGRYWYYITHDASMLCFKQPIYLV